jgi:hypothetical protein
VPEEPAETELPSALPPLDGSDTLLRDWTDNPFITLVPTASTNYAVLARCTADDTVNCAGTNNDTAFLAVTVDCPASGNLGFAQTVLVDAAKANLTWTTAASIDAIEGSLDTLRADAGFANSVNSCLADSVTTNTVAIAASPASGSGLYYLVKGAGSGTFCNEVSTWGDATRDSELAGATNVCP